MNKQEELRKKLSDLLGSPAIEVGEVLRTASELARLDEGQVWFSVDAGLIHRLGAELVTRQETALAELVKNAYDADATLVEVTFERTHEPGGTLVISDDGNGMDRDQLISGFMRISTADKVHGPVSPRYRRQRAGRKGIGRFAAQRLGRRLTLITQIEDHEEALQVDIDWSQFSSDGELIAVGNRISKVPKRRKRGTVLIIHELIDGWTDAKIERAYRYILDLIQPGAAPVSGPPNDAVIAKSDPGFKSRFLYENEEGRIVLADEHSRFLEHRTAIIEAWVDEGGAGRCKVDSPKYNVSDELDLGGAGGDSRPYEHLHGVRLSVSYFIIDKEHIPSLLLTSLRSALLGSGGVRLYRNGFRVRPYGEPGNDWLGLDESSARRHVLVPHGNRNFLGSIAIQDIKGKKFNETSSREGLIENDAFGELRRFGHEALVAAVLRIATARGRKGRTSNKLRGSTAQGVRKIAEQLAGMLPQAEERPGDPSPGPAVTRGARGGAGLPSHSMRGLIDELEHLAEAQEIEQAEHMQEVSMLRVLASLGMLIGQFTHEVRHILVALSADAASLGRPDMPDRVRQIAARMGENLKSLRTFSMYFDSTVAENVRRDLRPLDLRAVIGAFRDAMDGRAMSQGILMELDARGASLITRPMHPSEWASILLNLYTNAEKAIKKVGMSGRLVIRVGRSGERLFLDFADNGCGIPERDRERVFDPFFTTTSPLSSGTSGTEMVQGTGLGLTIVRDIVVGAGGTVHVTDPPEGYTTCLRVEVPCDGAQKGAR